MSAAVLAATEGTIPSIKEWETDLVLTSDFVLRGGPGCLDSLS